MNLIKHLKIFIISKRRIRNNQREIERFLKDLKHAGASLKFSIEIIQKKLKLNYGEAYNLISNSTAWKEFFANNPFNEEFNLHMSDSRLEKIEMLAGYGRINELKEVLSDSFTQEEIDTALVSAIAYSQIEIANYLLSLGADFSYQNFNGVYYAVHNNELEGLKFALENGVDVNLNNGILINEAMITSFNEGKTDVLEYLLSKGADVKLITDNILSTFGTNETLQLVQIK